MIVWVRKPECKQKVEEISTRDTPWTEYANLDLLYKKKSTAHYNYAFFFVPSEPYAFVLLMYLNRTVPLRLST